MISRGLRSLGGPAVWGPEGTRPLFVGEVSGVSSALHGAGRNQRPTYYWDSQLTEF